MDIEAFSADLAAEWDAFVQSSPEAWLFHTSAWIGIESKSARSVAFLVRSDRQIVAVCPMFVERWRYGGVIPAHVLHTGRARAGPALCAGLTSRQRRTVYAAIFEHIDRLARQHRTDRLQMRLPTLAPGYLPPDRPHANPLSVVRPFTPVRYGRSFSRGELVDKIVDLGVDREALWMGLDRKCRNEIRKSQASGVSVTEASSVDSVRAYHELHVRTYQQSAATPLPQSHFELLWNSLYVRGHLGLFLAEYDGRAVAGLLAFRFKNAASYWAGSSLYEFQTLRANNLLVWEAMIWAHRNGCRWFELGPTFPTIDQDSKAARIGRFKDQFGGNLYTVFEGTFDYRPVKMAVVDIVDALAARAVGAWRGRGAAHVKDEKGRR